MPPRPSDKALRRMVAELAWTDPEDVQAILADLDAGHREMVRGLLRGFAGELAAQPAPEAAAPKIEGLSPWLAARLDRACSGVADEPRPAWETDLIGRKGRTAFSMTPAALAALQAAASALPASGGGSGARASSSWIGRLLAGGRDA